MKYTPCCGAAAWMSTSGLSSCDFALDSLFRSPLAKCSSVSPSIASMVWVLMAFNSRTWVRLLYNVVSTPSSSYSKHVMSSVSSICKHKQSILLMHIQLGYSLILELHNWLAPCRQQSLSLRDTQNWPQCWIIRCTESWNIKQVNDEWYGVHEEWLSARLIIYLCLHSAACSPIQNTRLWGLKLKDQEILGLWGQDITQAHCRPDILCGVKQCVNLTFEGSLLQKKWFGALSSFKATTIAW